ncbi:MAG: lytic transglycosylase domain-containing protein [Beijerinckiaceae bacterium]|nr:lytic transglycosylase domain-containing protein [Beijerinckiaceae bacterium]
MFLFTNSPTSAATPNVKEQRSDTPLADAMRGAAQQTGISFEYLIKTATRESNLDPAAKARNSSATGLFQFLDQTWLQTVKTEGSKFGLQAEADQISQTSGGQFVVADPQARQRILALRTDPQVSAKIAGAFTARNAAVLADNLGRPPSEGELYIAHFLGASGASELIRLASQSPDASAVSSFSDAASANRSIFYDKSGRPRTAAEVYSNLVASHGTDPAAQAAGNAPTPPDAGATGETNGAYVAREAAKPIFGLFRGSDTGPVAQPIARTWTGLGRNPNGAAGTQVASLGRGGFFPRGDVASEPPANTVAAEPSPPEKSSSTAVPLPPERPAGLKPQASRRASTVGAPLNLLSFIRQRV